MLSSWIVIAVAFGYIGLLFAIASYGDRPGRGPRGRVGVLIYPLSLAIYCTSWTFFGSVGFAARTGPEFLAIYVGPVIMIGLCTPLLLRVIRLAKAQKITSIADFIAARYGKSQPVAALVALIAIAGSVPYIALQLKAVATSLETLLVSDSSAGFAPVIGDLALIVTMAMALFAVAFGTRHTDVTEHQHGLMLAVASESIVKLVAFLAVGACVTFVLFGPRELLTQAQHSLQASRVLDYTPSFSSFAVMTLLSFFAIAVAAAPVPCRRGRECRRTRSPPRTLDVPTLPRRDQRVRDPDRAGRPDQVPVRRGRLRHVRAGAAALGRLDVVTVAVFVGGLSAATAMVIVESVALAVMVSNTLVMPILLQRRAATAATPMSAAYPEGAKARDRRRAGARLSLLPLGRQRAAGLDRAVVVRRRCTTRAGILRRTDLAPGNRPRRDGGNGGRHRDLGLHAAAAELRGRRYRPDRLVRDGPFGSPCCGRRRCSGCDMPPLVHGVLWTSRSTLSPMSGFSLTRQPTPIERLQAECSCPAKSSAICRQLSGAGAPRSRSGNLTATVGRYLGGDAPALGFGSFAASTASRSSRRRRPISSCCVMPSTARLDDRRGLVAAGAVAAAAQAHGVARRPPAAARRGATPPCTTTARSCRPRSITCARASRCSTSRPAADLLEPAVRRNLDLPPAGSQSARRCEEILGAIAGSGRYRGGGTENFVASGSPPHQRAARRSSSASSTVACVIEVRANRMPDGGIVTTFTDITPSVEAAEALERANATLERRVRERTEELTRLNTELARAKGEADDANISKTRFLAAASHDLLQPLHAARLYVTSLAERKVEGDAGRLVANVGDSLEAIEECSARCSTSHASTPAR